MYSAKAIYQMVRKVEGLSHYVLNNPVRITGLPVFSNCTSPMTVSVMASTTHLTGYKEKTTPTIYAQHSTRTLPMPYGGTRKTSLIASLRKESVSHSFEI